MFPRLTCQQAARLITSRRDQPLPLHQRAALRLHLVACKACPTFDRQIELMHGAVGRWRSYIDQGDRP
jgi:hypothetical protein